MIAELKVLAGFIAAFAVVVAIQPWPRRAAGYAARRGLVPDAGTMAALATPLRRSRALVTTAIFGSAAVSIITSGPNRIDLQLGWVVASWLVAALIDVAWMLPRHEPHAVMPARPAPRWVMWSPVAMVIVLTATALTLVADRSRDTPTASLAVRGALAVASALLVAFAVWALARRPGLVAGRADLDAALRASAVQRVLAPGMLTAGFGVLLQIETLREHAGPLVSDALGSVEYAVAIGAPLLAWTLRTAVRWRGPLFPYFAAAVVIGVAVLSATRTGQAAAKERPPFSADALHPTVQVDVVTDATVETQERAYGFTTLPASPDTTDGAALFFGRATLAAPPSSAHGTYWLVAANESANARVALGDAEYGGSWDSSLYPAVARYPWLSPFALIHTEDGWQDPPYESAVLAPAGARTIEFWGYAPPGVGPADLTFGLIYVGTDDQLYWATRVPVL